MTIYYTIEKHQHHTHIGSKNLHIENIEEHAELTAIGSGNLTIHGSIENAAKIICTGSGNLSINGNLGNEVSVNMKGSGNLTIANNMGNQVSITKQGSGNLKINGSIGNQFILQINGSGNTYINGAIGDNACIAGQGTGDLIIAGNVGQQTHFNDLGNRRLSFKGTLHDEVAFNGELLYEVFFDTPPSSVILKKIKASQELALTSDSGFSQINGYEIKAGAGWVRIKEKGTDVLYLGNQLQIINDVKYIDGKMITNNKKSSIMQSINKFSNKHPIAFVVCTLGLGLLWYLKKLCSSTTQITINCNRSNDTKAFYLADLSRALNENAKASTDSSQIILNVMAVSSTNPQTKQNPSHQPPTSSKFFEKGNPDIQMPHREEQTSQNPSEITYVFK